jgi:Tfp pilus assembly protein PilO
MRRYGSRERVFVVSAGAVLVVFAYLLVFMLPAQRTLADLKRQQTQLRQQLEQAGLMYREGLAAQQQIAALKAQSQSLMFQSSDVQLGMVTQIEKLSKELGVTVTSIRPGEAELAVGSTRHPAVFKVDADLGKIVRLLYELEEPGRRLWVEGVEITSARQTGDVLSATIYVSAYSPSREREGTNGKA